MDDHWGEIPLFTLELEGEDKPTIKRHLLGLFFLGIAPTGLMWMLGGQLLIETLHDLSKSTSRSKYSDMIAGLMWFPELDMNKTVGQDEVINPWTTDQLSMVWEYPGVEPTGHVTVEAHRRSMPVADPWTCIIHPAPWLHRMGPQLIWELDWREKDSHT